MQSKILFIDDESGVLEALKWTFVDEPYDCLTCQTPDQALKLMEASDVAVVVSDQRMPEMDGTELLEKIKDQWPATIRILMTAYQEMNIVLEAINKGRIYNLIFKPWDERELKRVIKNAVVDYNLSNGGGAHEQVSHETNHLIELNRSLEMKNQYLMERLQNAQKMETLGNLASGIAHDFNNILLIINGCLNLAMIDNSLAPSVYKKLIQALQASSRAKDLVAQIHSFSNSENSGKPVKLGPLIKEIMEFIKAALPSSIEIRQNITINSEEAQVDPTKVYQILMNLCTNAASAVNGNDVGIVSIGLTRTRSNHVDHYDSMELHPGDYFCLTVRDNGVGIDQVNLERIFDPYFTTKQKKWRDRTGVGTD